MKLIKETTPERCNGVQTNDYYQIEIVIGNYRSVWKLFVLDRNT